MQLIHSRLTVAAALVCCGLALFLIGCDQSSSPNAAGNGESAKEPVATALPDAVILAEAPADAVSVAELKKSAREGDQVVIRVVVGGRVKPFVENRAIMTVVDAGMENVCLAPGDSCTTPWDYCCSAPSELQSSLATVRVADEQGQPLKVDLSNSPLIKPQSTIIVTGVVGPRPDPAMLVVDATGIYVESAP